MPVRDRFDRVIIDCPPSLGLLTINALTAADYVLIPVQCEYYALEGLSGFISRRGDPRLGDRGERGRGNPENHVRSAQQPLDDVGAARLATSAIACSAPSSARNVHLAEALPSASPVMYSTTRIRVVR